MYLQYKADVYCIIVFLNVKIILFRKWHFITYLTLIKGQFLILFWKKLISLYILSVWKILEKKIHVFSHEMAAILDFMILGKEHIL